LTLPFVGPGASSAATVLAWGESKAAVFPDAGGPLPSGVDQIDKCGLRVLNAGSQVCTAGFEH
jgi:hypothetical protein